jgi:hypothetical protein
MSNDSNLAVEQPVEQKSSYVSPEVYDYGDAGSLTKTNNGGSYTTNDGGSYPNAYTS